MKTKYYELDGISFAKETPRAAAEIVAQCVNDNRRYRVWYGDQDTGKDWGEENDVMGYIGLSMGPRRIPLLIHNRRSLGGGGLLTSSVVKMVDIKTHSVVYEHPKFHAFKWTTAPSQETGYSTSVFQDGSIYANCHTPQGAERLRAFMAGERFTK